MFCPNCGTKAEEKSTFCGSCGTPLEGSSQAKVNTFEKAQPYPSETTPNTAVSYTPPPNQQFQSQPYQNQVPGNFYYGLNTRDFWMWFILGICTCGIASIVYLYYNFDDARKLERMLQQKRGVPHYVTNTTDPALAIILSFVCSPITYLLKYQSLGNLINSYYPDPYLPRSPTTSRLIGVWVGIFTSFILGLVILPLLFVMIVLAFYLIYLDKEWQDTLNYYIISESRG